jgi:hypothetical protein
MVFLGIQRENEVMKSNAIATVVKMIETLPEETQDQVVEHLSDYLEDMRDNAKWDRAFRKTQPQLAAAAYRAKKEIAATSFQMR